MSNTPPVAPRPVLSATDAQARLILLDPTATDQAIQPVLRSSLELNPLQQPVLDRESARQLWEGLSEEPAQIQLRQAEQARAKAQADKLAVDHQKAQEELAALKVQAIIDRDNRWNHPLVYAGAASLLGLGGLWLLERRRRLQLQDKQLQDWAEASTFEWGEEAQPQLPPLDLGMRNTGAIQTQQTHAPHQLNTTSTPPSALQPPDKFEVKHSNSAHAAPQTRPTTQATHAPLMINWCRS
ncbi:MAG: hypothetical protein HC765_00875 [Brachymonas sp.]|nr:hypothetical protein [Brachymonas sp.]